jgi:deoxyribose-phosphate aldolase
MNLTCMIELARKYQQELPEVHPPESPLGTGIAAWIDHTLLKPDARPEQIQKLCQEARKHGFASVCINPVFVPLAVQSLQGSDVPVCTVIGFPLGATSTQAKVDEARWSLQMGAKELDMVIPIGLLKAGEYQAVYTDILAVTDTAHVAGALVKVILEMAYLDEFEKIMACLLCKEAKADFVKTSTGFGPSGATVQDVQLMRAVVGSSDQMGVKAAGGIRSYADAIAMIKAGATRIGASAGVQILAEAEGKNG